LVRLSLHITGEEETAKDIAQDLFVKLLNNPNKLDEIEDISNYLSVSVRNACFNHIKSKKDLINHKTPLVLQIVNEEYENDIDHKINLVRKLVERLPQKCRMIFSFSRFEGLTNQEIADYLGLSKRTVDTQISLALKTLRDGLKSYQ